MALSDWDKLCINHESKSFEGPFTNKEGNSVEIYKSGLYIHAPKMWQKGESSFTNPIIAQMSEGNISLAGFEIFAGRGKSQNAVFTLVLSLLPGDKYEYKVEGGIGCYGYEDDAYVVLKHLNRLSDYETGQWRSGWSSTEGDHIINLETHEMILHNNETKYLGVTTELLTEFCEWVKTLDLGREVKTWLEQVEKTPQLRFNQFDGQMSQTEIGKESPAEPLVVQIIKGNK